MCAGGFMSQCVAYWPTRYFKKRCENCDQYPVHAFLHNLVTSHESPGGSRPSCGTKPWWRTPERNNLCTVNPSELFMGGFMWIGVSAFWTANCHHWNPFECIVLCLPCTLLSGRLFECLIQIWGHRIEEGGGEAFLSPLRPVGHPARVNKQAGGTLLPSGGQWFPSKRRKSHKGSF